MTSSSELSGLNSVEARDLLKKHGANIVVDKKRISGFWIFFEKLTSPLFLLMIGISVVSFVVGQRASAIIVMMMIILSATLDFINSYKSQKAVDRLTAMVSTKTTVIRDGKKQEIDVHEVVPGDLIYLSAGSVIPADCQVVEGDDFFVNQSSLTGESMPVEKSVSKKGVVEKLTPENTAVVFMGTSVISGFATVRVLETGIRTEFGKVAKELNKAKPKTDFEINTMKFSFFIMKIVFYMVSFVFVAFLVKNSHDLSIAVILEAFTFALAVTIGVTPDMLPAIITVCLSKGSQMMAKKEVIVKQLSSIENFGSMDILCTDKTGTLTQDLITLIKYIDCNGKESDKIFRLGHLSSHFHTGAQNPLDTAVNNFKDLDVSDYEKIDEIPYDFLRKRSSMVVRRNGKRFLITKGAQEEIIKICHGYEADNKIDVIDKCKTLIEKQANELSANGFRVLGICYKEIPDDDVRSYSNTIENEMIFSGFLAFLDPPKESAGSTIAELEKLGIEVKILTGDNDVLTQKICRDLGLNIKGVMTGVEMANYDDAQLEKKIKDISIFARVTPMQKEKIILLLKKGGKTVGFLGDGINDAPALRAADVGISVNNAVDIAKDTADIILMQKSLEALKDGVLEGRKTFHNTMKYILMGLSSNFGNMFSMMGAVTFLPFLPMLPAQILFNNFVYDSSQFSLPTDDVDADELLKPAHWDLKFIRKYMIVFGSVSSIFDFLTFYLLYYVYHLTEHQFQTGWFIESIATQILVIYIIRTKKIPFLQSRPSRALFITTFTAVVISWLVQFTPFGVMMQLERLPLNIMMIIASYVFVYLVLVEFVKRIFYRMHFRSLKK
ncbi:magnesium-translocating P-type ATPase [Candidatus Parcubacteria bacterium]|nr:magnesium-translocating P-type ATPase [Patescibacteria group bacterium]MBU4309469.1 magnesium-translocating P-type ATPase [Patescibacteria group bacterium]MBU4432608.1 magnesium-translocating P-type ATPase [Patescibacteria group bacterium]MBU4577175.1 magnesium-translocating P-type ATPase [Patescibacteria group bacterium]MCG2696823.1 magnesium-translocating P-type ATPase [Candidatus Parcubacteria bacterium]